MKIAVVQFPGSNCERETIKAIQRAGMEPVPFLWNEPLQALEACDGYVIVGGFSYEDRSRAGVIASLDPVMKAIADQAAAGKPVLGICNGAQILVESGLVPGTADNKPCIALTDNKRVQHDRVLGTGFYNAWTYLKLHPKARLCAFTQGIAATETLHMPLAHAEGRFQMPSELLEKLKAEGMVIFQYSDERGKVSNEFPINPNGSMDSIAAISNYAGNVMAIMPHPERTEKGDAIFSSMHDFIAEKEELRKGSFKYLPKPYQVQTFSSKKGVKQLLVDQIVTDNEAMSVQVALSRLGVKAVVKRYVFWQVECTDEAWTDILASEELFNPKKEFVVDNLIGDCAFLVKHHEDFLGQQKFQILANHFEVNGIKTVTKATLWVVESKSKQVKEKLLESGLLFNQASADCFEFNITHAELDSLNVSECQRS